MSQPDLIKQKKEKKRMLNQTPKKGTKKTRKPFFCLHSLCSFDYFYPLKCRGHRLKVRLSAVIFPLNVSPDLVFIPFHFHGVFIRLCSNVYSIQLWNPFDCQSNLKNEKNQRENRFMPMAKRNLRSFTLFLFAHCTP